MGRRYDRDGRSKNRDAKKGPARGGASKSRSASHGARLTDAGATCGIAPHSARPPYLARTFAGDSADLRFRRFRRVARTFDDLRTPAAPEHSAHAIVEPVIVEPHERWFPWVAFVVVAAAVVIVSVWAFRNLPLFHHQYPHSRTWVHAFGWWDGWWYRGISRHGYSSFSPHRQSPVAFFPAYPLLMRFLSPTDDPMVTGVLLTLACGLGDAVLFHRWCRAKLGTEKARVCLLVFLLYPFAFFLMGAVYADALFLLAALGAFLALEADRPLLAGLAAAVATATRPVGAALVVGLWVLALERRGFFEKRDGPNRPALRPKDAGLLLAPAGLLAYCLYLYLRFGRPLAFIEVAGAPGWGQRPGPQTWLKLEWLKAMMASPYLDGHHAHIVGNALAAAVALALVPWVFRRFGLGYGVFAIAAVLGAALSTRDFIGMGRYVLAAFPCFAAAGDFLYARRLTWLVLGASGATLVLLAELHARGTLVS